MLPGRIRIHHSGLHRNPALAQALCKKIKTLPGIVSVEANVYTGNLLIKFECFFNRYKKSAFRALHDLCSFSISHEYGFNEEIGYFQAGDMNKFYVCLQSRGGFQIFSTKVQDKRKNIFKLR